MLRSCRISLLLQLPQGAVGRSAAAAKMAFRGTLAGSLPFALFYILPYAFNPLLKPWMIFSSLSLVLIPLCFGYAIIRYRLMDVDIIFKRGLAHTAATAAVAAVFFSLVGLSGDIFHTSTNDRLVVVLAITIASFLFQPVREWIQRRLDHFFLPRSLGLSPYVDRIRPDAHQ
jgi:hypothetical protein